MWLLKLLLSLLFLTNAFCNLSKNIDLLTNNLFDNLRADPKLLLDAGLSEDSSEFINHQLDNYKKIILNVKENAFRSKRSLNNANENHLDVQLYKNASLAIEMNRMDIFFQDGNFYGAGLDLDELKIFKFQNLQFLEIVSVESKQGTLKLFNTFNKTVLILNNIQELILYNFYKDQLTEFQRIQKESVSDTQLWDYEETIYLALLTKTTIEIYQWREKYFDFHQTINLDDAVGKIVAFSMQNDQFLAFCNSHPDHFKTYSEIYKLNLDSKKYEIFQKIATNSCTDISLFRSLNSDQNEDFLLVTNRKNEPFGNTVIYKYIDSYFIPFQNIELPQVHQWTSIKVNENAILFANNQKSLKGFYYDNWHFVEIAVNHNFHELNELKFFEFENKSVLVAVDKTEFSLFEIAFIKKEKPTKNLLNWCQNNLEEFGKDSEVEILVGKPSRGDIEVDETDEAFRKLDSNSLTKNEMDSEEFENIMKTIKSYKNSINEIGENIAESLQSNTEHIFEDLSAKHFMLNQEVFLNNLNTKSFNNFNIDDILSQKLNINDGFEIDGPLDFEFVRLEGSHILKNINNKPLESLLKLEEQEIEDLVVKGEIKAESINIELMNDKSINKNDIILTNHDQDFNTFTLEDLKVNKLNFKFFNGMDMTKINFLDRKKSISHIEEIKVPKIFVGGFINEVDMQTLDEFTLRAKGNQEISSTWFFDDLTANNLNSNFLAGENLKGNLVLINKGQFKVNKDVRFTKDMTVNNLIATEFLGSIPVKNGELEILKKASKDVNYIYGLKKFNHIKLLNPIKLKGKIRSEDLESVNPIRTIEEDLVLTGNLSISGSVQILEFLKAKNINASNDLSLGKLIKNGLELTETTIKNHLHFIQQLNVKNVDVETINRIDPKTWLTNGQNQDQIIKGSKIIEGDLIVSGNTDTFTINNIKIPDLESSTLTRTGDQSIRGKLEVKFVDSKSVISSKTFLNQNRWEDVLSLDNDQFSKSTIILNNIVHIPEINVESIQIQDHVNDFNFSKIVKDAVSKSRNRIISGRKTFNDLVVKNISADQGIDLENALKSLHPDIRIAKDLHIKEEADVENLIFGNTFNGMNALDFKEFLDRQQNFSKSLLDKPEFESITVYGGAEILSNLINDIPITSIRDDTVKIDEPFHFENAIFDQFISVDQIINAGQIENLDLDNVFENNSTEEQTIIGEIFYPELYVNGTIFIKDLVNNKNVCEICDFVSIDRETPIETIITGNVIFSKDPHFFQLNNVSGKDLFENTWIKDEETTIKSHMKLSEVTFLKDLQINGYLNGIRPQYLADNYVSKSAEHQSIQSNLYFEDVVEAEFISTPQIDVKSVNGLDLKEFQNEILLNDIDQLFENTLFLEECIIESLSGDFLVNNLNLEQDIMRYSEENLITGSKIIKNLNVHQLRINNSSNINDVDILQWLEDVVLKTANHEITGVKTFSNLSVKNGVNLQSNTLNGNIFNNKTIMLRDLDQKILGQKTFLKNVDFNSVKHRGLIDGVNIEDLVERLAFKNKDNQFKSQMAFNNTIVTNNLSIKKKIQGTKVTKLLSKLMNLDALNNFMDSYNNLLDMSQIVRDSLKGKMHMLSYFKPAYGFKGIQKLLTVQNMDELLIAHNANGTLILMKYGWDREQEIFYGKNFQLNLGPFPHYINKIYLNGQLHIYLENFLKHPQDVLFAGRILTLNGQISEEIANFPSNGSNFATTFALSKLSTECLITTGAFEAKIMCLTENGLEIYQKIPVSNIFMASVVNIDNTPYIVFIRNGDIKGPNDEATTSIWKFSNKSNFFEPHQEFFEEGVVSVSIMEHFHEIYLAIAYTYPSNAKLGKIIITRYEKRTDQFEQWQILHTKHSPTTIELISVNNQLMLNMLTKHSLIVYMYEGISGFRESLIYNNILPGAFNMNWFSMAEKYFIGLQKNDEIEIVQAVFK